MPLLAAYIVPHPPLAVAEVGRGQERAISATLAAYREVARRIAKHAPETLVFISPHSAYYADWIYVASGDLVGDLSEFRAPELRFTLERDQQLSELIISCAQKEGLPAGTVESRPRKLDHGLMVPLYFIEQASPQRYQGVSIGGSGLPPATLVEFGRCIARAIAKQDRDIVLVVSGDLSHKLTLEGPYGFDPAGPVFDETFGEIVRGGDLMPLTDIDPRLAESAAECGLSGFTMLAGALDEAEPRFVPELLSLEGPFGVGYGVVACEVDHERP